MGHVPQGQRLVGRERRAVLEMGRSHQHAAAPRGVRRGRAATGRILGAADIHAGRRPEWHERGHAGGLGNADLRARARRGDRARLRGRPVQPAELDFTYYSKTTNNEIVNQPVAPSTGFSGKPAHQPRRVDQQRHRAGGKAAGDHAPDFNWEIDGNLTTINNRSRATSRNAIASYGTSTTSSTIRSADRGRAGSSRRIAIPTTNLATNMLCDGGAGKAPVACASAPFVVHRQPDAEVTFAFGNTFMIGKSLRLYALVDCRRGNGSWNQNEQIRCDGTGRRAAVPRELLPAGVLADYLAESLSATRRSRQHRPVHGGRLVREAPRAVGHVHSSRSASLRRIERRRSRSPRASSTRGRTTAGSIPRASR